MPDGGDPFRGWGRVEYSADLRLGQSQQEERGARSQDAEGGAAARVTLIRTADVVIENFRAGTMDRLGLGYDALAADNPGLDLVLDHGLRQRRAVSRRGRATTPSVRR